MSDPERPHLDDLPETWPSTSANSFRQQYMAPGHLRTSVSHQGDSNEEVGQSATTAQPISPTTPSTTNEAMGISNVSSEETQVASSAESQPDHTAPAGTEAVDHADLSEEEDPDIEAHGGFAPIKASATKDSASEGFAPIKTSATKDSASRPSLYQSMTRRQTSRSDRASSYLTPQVSHSAEDQVEIERLMSRMFGKNRQEHSEEEKTRHVGLVFKDLTVKGVGLGAALQPTVGDIFLNLPRLIQGFIGKGPKIGQKPPIRTIVNRFTGCVRPGEMLLVLGKPGSGCSTFLKVLANQRDGYESVDGDVTYGGTDAKTMGKHYRGEIVYNPEDDLHYATISVKNT